MSKMKNKYLDFSDYFNDEEKVSKEDKAIIELETLLIGKKIKEKNIESEYDLKIYKEYLKQKEEGTLKTYSHKEVWKEHKSNLLIHSRLWELELLARQRKNP